MAAVDARELTLINPLFLDVVSPEIKYTRRYIEIPRPQAEQGIPFSQIVNQKVQLIGTTYNGLAADGNGSMKIIIKYRLLTPNP